MSILRLFDVSQYIYSGVAKKFIDRGVTLVNGVYETRSIPCAGITNVLNTYLQFKEPDTDLIFCFDSIPTFKRELHKELFPYKGGYKGNRKEKTSSIIMQLKLAEEILTQIGIRVIKIENYEADDIIASIVGLYKNSYDKIYIHSRDSDLYYLISPNVEVVPVMRLGKHINITNYEQMVDREYMVAYNTLTLIKMEKGEYGDNIPPVSREIMRKILKEIPKTLYPSCGDNILLRQYIKEVSNNDKITMGIFDLIAPRILDRKYIEFSEEERKESILDAYAVECGCRGYCNTNSIYLPQVEDTLERYIEEYKSKIRLFT